MKRSIILIAMLFLTLTLSNVSATGFSGINGDNQIKVNSEFSIYPNPATTEFTIQFKSDIQGFVDIKMFNALGTVVFSKCFELLSGNSLINIPLESNKIKSGMYYVLIENGQFSKTQKLIVK
jgi:hypothetical protein